MNNKVKKMLFDALYYYERIERGHDFLVRDCTRNRFSFFEIINK